MIKFSSLSVDVVNPETGQRWSIQCVRRGDKTARRCRFFTQIWTNRPGEDKPGELRHVWSGYTKMVSMTSGPGFIASLIESGDIEG